jgi:hypothetical protein
MIDRIHTAIPSSGLSPESALSGTSNTNPVSMKPSKQLVQSSK